MRPGKIEGMLGLAAKAGKLVYGCELTLDAVRGDKAGPYLVLVAADASEGTKKKVRNSCTYYRRRYEILPFGAECLSHATGREGLIAVVAVKEKGFAEAIVKLLSAETTDEKQK